MVRVRAWLLLASAATTVVAAGSRPYDAATHQPLASTGCGKQTKLPRGSSKQMTGTFGGVEFTWRIHLPKDYDENTPHALIVHHPGWGLSASAEEAGAGISILSDSRHFISVTAQGPGDNTHGGGPWYSWNAVGTTQSPGPAGPTCTEKADHPAFCYTSCEHGDGYETYASYASYGELPNKCGDEPQCWWTTCHETVTPSGTGRDVGGFIPSLLDTLEDTLCIDTTREYASGESNGGMMTYQLGADLGHRLAAIVPEFGSFHRGFNMAPLEGVPVLDLHGTNDDTVPANYSLSGDGYDQPKIQP
jgi:poly(3-hydroxybutyrate) depolymerase